MFLTLLYSNLLMAQSWDELAYQGKKFHKQGDLIKAIEFLSKAAEKRKTDNYELYLHAGILAARLKDTDRAFALLNSAINSGMWDIPRLERNSRLAYLKKDLRWSGLIDRINEQEKNYIKKSGLTHPELRKELKLMWAKDQVLVGKSEQKDVIQSNSLRLEKIIQKTGWPTSKMVGKDGVWFAWALAQHSFDIEFQKRCLSHLKNLTEAGEINPIYYAELNDRIARNLGVKQTYGMAIISQNGEKVFYPIADVEKVDERRSKIGLPPLKVWANENFVEVIPVANK